MSEDQLNSNYEIDFQEIEKFFVSYLKIISLSFFLPVWIALMINEGTILWKIISWAQDDILFWEVERYFKLTMVVLLVPLVYIFWFYYVAIKRVLLRMHDDFFRKWTLELSNVIAQVLIQQYTTNDESKGEINLDRIFLWINEKISYLPKWLQWISKRLFDQIPIIEFVTAYDFKDLENGNEEKIAYDVNQKINEMQLDLIESIVPWWTVLVIPVNILLLIYYIRYQ